MLPSPTSNDSSKEKDVSLAFNEDVGPLDHVLGSGMTLVRALSLALQPGMHVRARRVARYLTHHDLSEVCPTYFVSLTSLLLTVQTTIVVCRPWSLADEISYALTHPRRGRHGPMDLHADLQLPTDSEAATHTNAATSQPDASTLRQSRVVPRSISFVSWRRSGHCRSGWKTPRCGKRG